MDQNGEFLQKLLATFKVEASEHLREITSSILELEKNTDPAAGERLIETAFREAHSLKGASRAVNLGGIESLCQALESAFSAVKKRTLEPSAELFDLLLQVLDHLGKILPTAESERPPEDKSLQRNLIKKLEGVVGTDDSVPAAETRYPLPDTDSPRRQSSEKPSPTPPSQAPVATETLRISSKRLSAVLLQSEEMLFAKLSAGQRANDMRNAAALFPAWKKEWAGVLPFVQRLRRKMSNKDEVSEAGENRLPIAKILDFLEWNRSYIATLEDRFGVEAKAAERESRNIGSMVNNLLDEMKTLLMFPFSSLLEILPKVVRDLSRDSGKEVELTVHGGEIEIDRRILDVMKDPLIHLVRNCIDHGIEKPETRTAKNKPPCGSITVTVAPRDDKVDLIVADDGAGVPISSLRSVVSSLGLVSTENQEALSERELLAYIFHSGISTSPILTDLSGRGLGLAIVKENVEKLGGSVSLETAPDTGTSVRIVLPITVATFRGILVRAGERPFVLPMTHVERVFRLTRDEIRTVENRETIHVEGQTFSLVRIVDILGLNPSVKREEFRDIQQAVLLTAAGMSIAFLVDEVAGEREVLFKHLGPQLSRVRNVAGATVLSSGELAPILNIPDLLKSAVKHAASPLPTWTPGKTERGEVTKQTVMVVEDSITTRTLLRNILEGAGYDVVTAVDGLDALTRLRSGPCDIVVSDVDMPRMNGFDLTAKIRTDKDLDDLPVVLVTALASDEDRERGIDTGANAYIVKSSFDQSNLLEVVKRLL